MDKLKSSIIIKHTSDGRPTFGWKNSNEVVRACGVVISYLDTHGRSYLIRKETKGKKMIYCDIGGKTDPEDKCLLDTLCREVAEETNAQLFGKHGYAKCMKLLMDVLEECDLELYYDFSCKYMVVKIIMDYHSLPKHLKYFKSLPMKRFGKIEKTTQKEHYYKWMRNVNKDMIHFRLKKMHEKLFSS